MIKNKDQKTIRHYTSKLSLVETENNSNDSPVVIIENSWVQDRRYYKREDEEQNEDYVRIRGPSGTEQRHVSQWALHTVGVVGGLHLWYLKGSKI